MHILQTYHNIKEYETVKRKNRLAVLVRDNDGKKLLAHLTNTGRLHELIYEGNKCICVPKKHGKTSVRLIAVPVSAKDAVLIDPAEQSKAFVMAAKLGLIPWLKGWKISKPEVKVGESRIDFEIESEDGQKGYIELKSAALLKEDHVGSFPDCPSERGQKQVRTMRKLAQENIRSIILFVVAHPHATVFSPNSDADPIFAELI